jgi:hypothetical protein
MSARRSGFARRSLRRQLMTGDPLPRRPSAHPAAIGIVPAQRAERRMERDGLILIFCAPGARSSTEQIGT